MGVEFSFNDQCAAHSTGINLNLNFGNFAIFCLKMKISKSILVCYESMSPMNHWNLYHPILSRITIPNNIEK